MIVYLILKEVQKKAIYSKEKSKIIGSCFQVGLVIT